MTISPVPYDANRDLDLAYLTGPFDAARMIRLEGLAQPARRLATAAFIAAENRYPSILRNVSYRTIGLNSATPHRYEGAIINDYGHPILVNPLGLAGHAGFNRVLQAFGANTRRMGTLPPDATENPLASSLAGRVTTAYTQHIAAHEHQHLLERPFHRQFRVWDSTHRIVASFFGLDQSNPFVDLDWGSEALALTFVRMGGTRYMAKSDAEMRAECAAIRAMGLRESPMVEAIADAIEDEFGIASQQRLPSEVLEQDRDYLVDTTRSLEAERTAVDSLNHPSEHDQRFATVVRKAGEKSFDYWTFPQAVSIPPILIGRDALIAYPHRPDVTGADQALVALAQELGEGVEREGLTTQQFRRRRMSPLSSPMWAPAGGQNLHHQSRQLPRSRDVDLAYLLGPWDARRMIKLGAASSQTQATYRSMLAKLNASHPSLVRNLKYLTLGLDPQNISEEYIVSKLTFPAVPTGVLAFRNAASAQATYANQFLNNEFPDNHPARYVPKADLWLRTWVAREYATGLSATLEDDPQFLDEIAAVVQKFIPDYEPNTLEPSDPAWTELSDRLVRVGGTPFMAESLFSIAEKSFAIHCGGLWHSEFTAAVGGVWDHYFSALDAKGNVRQPSEWQRSYVVEHGRRLDELQDLFPRSASTDPDRRFVGLATALRESADIAFGSEEIAHMRKRRLSYVGVPLQRFTELLAEPDIAATIRQMQTYERGLSVARRVSLPSIGF